tara:strand:- start:955 stop:1197 length:243 start_codon:yes stop_codon:yes gene_type:complete
MDLKRCATCFGYFTGDPENCPVCARHEAAPDDLQASIHALSADFASLSASLESMQSRLVTLNRLAADAHMSARKEVRPNA